jgi:hypothetical protein
MKIFVRLLNEGTDVWVPVTSRQVSEHVFELGRLLVSGDDDVTLEFPLGTRVIVTPRRMSDSEIELIAVAKAPN